MDVLGLRTGEFRGLVPVMRIDAAFVVDADLREPHPRHVRGFAVVKLQRHADAAHESVAVMPERALAHQEPLHRRVRDPAPTRPTSPPPSAPPADGTGTPADEGRRPAACGRSSGGCESASAVLYRRALRVARSE